MKRMKKHLSMLLILVVALAAFGCGKKEEAVKEGALYTPGTYTAEEKGHNGNVKVTVTVTEDKIENIEVDLMDETEGIAGPAAEKIVDLVLKNQGLGVDTVSGATVSSTAILAAITAALKEAGADVEALKNIKAEEEVLEVSDKEADIVIIGAGGAGMAAAVEAATLGKSVIIVEKMPIVGGNTNRATGGINAAETSIQEKEGIEDTIETYYDDTFKGGKEENDPELLKVMVENSAEAVDWLNELGAGLTRVSLSGGATNPRIHTPEDGSAVGPVVVKVLENKLKELGVEILMETTAKSIIEENGAAAGVEVENVNGNSFKIHAKAVIIASGGFGANSDMVESFRADLVGFSTTNHAGATGDGIELGQEAGAALDDIEFIQIHPTTDPESGYMFTEGLRGDGAILLNSQGVRFTDELLTRDVVSANILKQEGGIAYLVTNEEMKE
ncbi:flavocytochrome c, partial [Proteiniclasticum ruminis]|uniref:flavocytochrome c n=1 Tax=Proteiniclasticum ruminis TaxID=398199 RepID=UPI0028A73BD1